MLAVLRHNILRTEIRLNMTKVVEVRKEWV